MNECRITVECITNDVTFKKIYIYNKNMDKDPLSASFSIFPGWGVTAAGRLPSSVTLNSGNNSYYQQCFFFLSCCCLSPYSSLHHYLVVTSGTSYTRFSLSLSLLKWKKEMLLQLEEDERTDCSLRISSSRQQCHDRKCTRGTFDVPKEASQNFFGKKNLQLFLII